MIAVEQVKDVPAYIRQMYTDNHFMTQFGVHIGEIKCGSAEVTFWICLDKLRKVLPVVAS